MITIIGPSNQLTDISIDENGNTVIKEPSGYETTAITL